MTFDEWLDEPQTVTTRRDRADKYINTLTHDESMRLYFWDWLKEAYGARQDTQHVYERRHQTNDETWPERLRLRDTKLHDDLGGAGQRIFTTSGQGYEKEAYIRADVVSEMEGRAVMRFVTALHSEWKSQDLEKMNALLRDVAEGDTSKGPKS